MSHIHFVGGEKGGVGKSVVARVLCQYFVDRSAPFAAIDADASHATLLRSYAEYTQPIDLEVFASADEIVNRALGAERDVVVDLPAQSARALQRWVESADVIRFAREAGIQLTLWHVSDGSFDSIRDLARAVETWADSLAYVVVRNHGRSRDFSLLDESAARREVEQLGGRVIDLPELDAATMVRIDRTGASLWAAANNASGDQALAPLQRQRARLWLDRCYAAVDGVRSARPEPAPREEQHVQLVS